MVPQARPRTGWESNQRLAGRITGRGDRERLRPSDGITTVRRYLECLRPSDGRAVVRGDLPQEHRLLSAMMALSDSPA
jgi:hypothetical protein